MTGLIASPSEVDLEPGDVLRDQLREASFDEETAKGIDGRGEREECAGHQGGVYQLPLWRDTR
jgi:hypothetical protein